MLKIGDTGMGSIRLGNQKIVRAYLGSTVVFDQAAPPAPSFVITVSVDPEGGGTASGGGTYQLGESVTVTAVSGDGYEFSGWMENGVVVSTDGSYTFTVSGDRDLVAVFEEIKPSRLPEGYTELEYIDSGVVDGSAAAYTNLNISAQINMRIVADYSGLSYSSLKQISVVGGYGSESSKYYGVWISQHLNYLSKDGIYCSYVAGGSTVNNKVSADNSLRRVLIDWDIPSKTIYVDGELYTGTVKAPTAMAYRPYMYFPQITSQVQGSVRLYSLKIYYADEIVGDFVPAKDSNGVAGLYNTIKNTFHKSANSAQAFIAGPAV